MNTFNIHTFEAKRNTLADFHRNPDPLKSYAEHFKDFVSILWAEQFEWNPNAERMLEAATKHQEVGLFGCMNSGKTYFLAAYAVAKFLIDPYNTQVQICEMSSSQARVRIWRVVEKLWNETEAKLSSHGPLPGKLIPSRCAIDAVCHFGSLKDRGISLECYSHRVSDFSGTAATSIRLMDSLASSRLSDFARMQPPERGQVIGSGNPCSIYDPLGCFCAPQSGWKPELIDADEWPTEKGVCLHFDGEKSPNKNGSDWNGLISISESDYLRGLGPTDGSRYLRLCRGFPTDLP